MVSSAMPRGATSPLLIVRGDKVEMSPVSVETASRTTTDAVAEFTAKSRSLVASMKRPYVEVPNPVMERVGAGIPPLRVRAFS